MEIKYFKSNPNASRLVDKINDLNTGLVDVIGQISKYENVNGAIQALSDAMLVEFEIENEDTNSKAFLNFLAKCGVYGFLQKFDNDKNFDKLREHMDTLKSIAGSSSGDSSKKGGSDEDYSEEYEGSDEDFLDELESMDESEINADSSPQYTKEEVEEARNALDDFNKKFGLVDFMFAFEGFADMVYDAVDSNVTFEGEHIVLESIEVGLLISNIRPVSVSEYCDGDYVEKDITLIELLVDKTDTGIPESIKTIIDSDNFYRTLKEGFIASVYSVYKYLLQDSFGLKPYTGVLTKNSPYLVNISPSNMEGNLPEANTVFRGLVDVLWGYYNVDIDGSRQFDIKRIIDTKTPYYYPYKMLEYMMGRKLTYNIARKIYRPHESSISWDAYGDDYVRPQIEHIAYEAICYSLEKSFNFSEFGLKKKSFESTEFRGYISNSDNFAEVQYALSKEVIRNKVRDNIKLVSKSMCTCCLVRNYNNIGNKVNSMIIRVVDVNGNMSLNITKRLFSQYTANEQIEYQPGYVITDGKTIIGTSDKLPYDIIEYSHDFDEMLSGAEPLFGYKAVEMFMKRGVKITWKKMLLGEDNKGTPIFASSGNPDDLPLQEQFIHNIFAGSRAGKGVMTMNMLASAIADGKPVFYLDRKPDISIMLFEKSNGGMFIVNGGQLEGEDPRGVYSPDKQDGVLAGWKDGYNNAPDYLKSEYFDDTMIYTGNFGDMVYLRAFVFMWGIIRARTAAKKGGNSEVLSALGGSNGIVVVVDEVSRWQSASMENDLGPKGFFFEDRRINDVNYEKILHNEKLSDEEKQSKLAMAVKPIDVYINTFTEKMAKTYSLVDELAKAGFRQNEEWDSDMIVIGQDLKPEPMVVNSKTIHDKISQGYSNVNRSKSFMRAVLECVSHDYILGRNDSDMLGTSDDKSMAGKLLTETKSFWGYYRGSGYEGIDKVIGSAPDGVRYFKPYLVLNNNLEDDPEHPRTVGVDEDGKGIPDPEFTYVTQCRGRVNKAAKGMWEKVRLKHLSDTDRADAELYEQTNGAQGNKHYGALNPGIGFDGLVAATMATNGKEYHPETDLSKSGQIANWVAQKMGYSDYRELLFDMSPYGLFSAQDVSDAILGTKDFTNAEARLPLFKKYNIPINGGSADGGEQLGGKSSERFVTPVEQSAGFDISQMEGESVYDAPQGTMEFGTSQMYGSGEQMGYSDDDYDDSDDSDEEFHISYDEFRQMVRKNIQIVMRQANQSIPQDLIETILDVMTQWGIGTGVVVQ